MCSVLGSGIIQTLEFTELLDHKMGNQSSNNAHSSSEGQGARYGCTEIKTCYYELLGVDRLASDEE